MQRRKESAPQPASNRGTQSKSNHRLSQSEWNDAWNRDGWILVAGWTAVCILVTLIETGVLA